MLAAAHGRLARAPFSAGSGLTRSRGCLNATQVPLQRHCCQCRASQRRAIALVPLLSVPFLSSPAQAAEAAQSAVPVDLVLELAELDSKTAGTLSAVLKPLLSLASVLMIVRIVMSWYPEIDGKAMPWSIAYTPTGTPGQRARAGLSRACAGAAVLHPCHWQVAGGYWAWSSAATCPQSCRVFTAAGPNCKP